MPIVLRAAGFDVSIYLPPREHGPAHVHVRRAGEKIVIWLDPIGIRDMRMSDANVRAGLRLVAQHRDYLLAEWRRFHG